MPTENSPKNFNNPKPENEIGSETIKDLLYPVSIIAKEIKTFVDHGDYAIIIGDDASGRLPALIFREIINKVYEKSGRTKIDTRFLALYSPSSYSDVWDSIIPQPVASYPEVRSSVATEKIKLGFVDKLDRTATKDKKVLVVTDTISSGSSLKPLITTLREADISFDIACIGMISLLPPAELGAENVFFGKIGLPSIYAQRELAGVEKDENNFSLKTKLIKSPHETKESMETIQLTINKARRDAHLIADQVFEMVVFSNP